jgi:hypothetical protein
VPSLADYVIVIVPWLFVTLLAALGYPAIAVYIILPVDAIRRRGSGA